MDGLAAPVQGGVAPNGVAAGRVMSLLGLFGYLLGAALYAIVAAVIVSLGRAAWTGQRVPPAFVVLVLATGFVIFMGLHPFPSPGSVECKRVLLDPRGVAEPYMRLWRNGAPLSAWLGNLGIVSVPANFVFFMGVGAALAFNAQSLRTAFLFGVGVSGFIEVSQLTGLWGVYSCAYRHFETADLLLNVGGVVAGFALVRAWRGKRLASPAR